MRQEEEKELGWLRLSQLFGVSAGICFACASTVQMSKCIVYAYSASWPISPKSGAVRNAASVHLRLYRFKSSRDTL